MAFPVGANEQWIFVMNFQSSSNTTADSKWLFNAPAGATCDFSVLGDTGSAGNMACGASSGSVPTATGSDIIRGSGYISVGGTAGSVQAQFGQNAASGTSTIFAGSWVMAWKVSGADLAEMYYTREDSLKPGMVVAIDSTLRAGVKATTQSYEGGVLGVISTQPGVVLGNGADSGQDARSVPLALTGRVPVKVSTENGIVHPGDILTSSSTPGVAMRATKAGAIIGQALTGFDGDGVGEVTVFIKTSYGMGSGASELANGVEASSPDFAKNILSTLMTNSDQLITQPDMSEIVTDRLVAGLEVITPRLTTDEVVLNSIESATAEGRSE